MTPTPISSTLPTGFSLAECLGRPAIRTACHRALAARERLLATYPNWQDWRREARAVKTEAIARLDELLDRLEREVTAWGGRVLHARDAAQARRLILEVAHRHQVRTVVKSKSMTTEEIGLNPALAAAGLRVTETDLGEFIVQTAGHPPAHLTAPALHLDRHQIAQILEKPLGQTCPPDPIALTRQASQYLRPHFGKAQMGITGVNFAAAADGALICVENEGNLRQSASRPPVHLALMGLEKVIPDLSGLEYFLRLLPASATGQRLTGLVHFFRGLKPHPQGSQAFYLVVLDNGRRKLAAHPELQEALYCLRCGACLNICPVFQAGAAHLYGRVYPGAIGILLAPYLAPVGDISDFCSQCGACADLCPAAIRLPEKIRWLRRTSPHFRRVRALSGAAGQVLSRPRLYRQIERGLRLWQKLWLLPGEAGPAGMTLAPESFFRRQQVLIASGKVGGGGQGPVAQASSLWEPPAPSPKPPPPTPLGGMGEDLSNTGGDAGATSSLDLLETRLQEAGSLLHRVNGPAALARLLAQEAGEPLWLEEHPWLVQAAPELAKLGLHPQFPQADWAPEVDTAVTVGLGAIPETGSVLAPLLAGPGAWLPFQARQHLMVIPINRANLTIPEALELTRRQPPGLLTWLTGPTRTADIEKVLVLGAQGPAAAAVVLYQPEE